MIRLFIPGFLLVCDMCISGFNYSFGRMAVCREIVYHGTESPNICVCHEAKTPGVKSGRKENSEKCMKTEIWGQQGSF